MNTAPGALVMLGRGRGWFEFGLRSEPLWDTSWNRGTLACRDQALVIAVTVTTEPDTRHPELEPDTTWLLVLGPVGSAGSLSASSPGHGDGCTHAGNQPHRKTRQ